jgi:micrococcal nuclease
VYEYKCRVIKVIDGDTVDAEVDLGFRVTMQMRFRLAGIDAPEMGTAQGLAAKQQLIALFSDAASLADAFGMFSPLTVSTQKDKQEKYGRYLGTFFQNGISMSINQQMIDKGMAKEWT